MKKLNSWQIFKMRKELAGKLKLILEKVINNEELSKTEIDFLKLIIKK